MSAHISTVLAHKLATGEPLQVNASGRNDTLRVLYFNAQRVVGFAIVVSDTGSLQPNTLVKLTLHEGRLQLRTVARAKLDTAIEVRQLVAALVAELLVSLTAVLPNYSLRNSRLFSL